jgi:hypothetical protein
MLRRRFVPLFVWLVMVPLLWAWPASPVEASSAPTGEDISRVALAYLSAGRSPARTDCSGLIEEILREAGLPGYTGAVSHMLATARADDLLVPVGEELALGDLLVFSFTYCKAGMDSRLCNPDSHIALVVRREIDGTWSALHYSSSRDRPALLRIDPRAPGEARRNDHLAMPGQYPTDRLVRSGELLSSVARLGALAEREAQASRPRPVVPTPIEEPVIEEQQVEPPADKRRWLRRRRGRSAADSEDSLTPVVQKDGQDALQQLILEGRRLPEASLAGLGCEELWVLRNSVFAAKGYLFQTQRAQRFFAAQPWYVPDAAVRQGTAWAVLSRVDRANVELLVQVEVERGCR